MVSTRSQLMFGVETPCKRSQPHHPAKKSVRETGSPSKEKRGKRARVEEKAQLKTPKQTQTVKRKKVRPRVVREGKTSEPGVQKSSSAGTKTSQSTTSLRPKRSTRRNLSFDYDLQEQNEYYGLNFPKRRRTSHRTRPRNFQALKTLLEGIGPQLKAIVSTGKLADGQEQKAIVQYMGGGKKNPPKVQLDDETQKVWKLLSLSIDSEGVDGADENKQKWWREERKIFQGRANSFIARMSQVQGDRRFSLWKGSVVDSVVGVFLTQNVADHSSSSVFMDIAAEFPINLNYNKGSCYEERGSSVTHETVMNLDPGNAAATPRIRNPNCIIIQEIDDDEDTDAASQETFKTSDSSISSTNKMLLDPATVSFETHFGSEARETVNCDEEEKKRACSRLGLNDYQDQEKKTRTEQKGKKPTNSRTDWDCLKKQAESGGQKRERTEITMDTVDWNAVRRADVNKITALIRKRGMNKMLSERIKAFLNRLVLDHGSIDLEWLRDVHPDKAKEYLLSINGLGLKSVECVRLLSLHQIAFPVDTNVGRIAVRLGWVPLQPLPDELQMHLLELYPVLESVQKYLWPRLCKLDQKTLYELHYHMITFGKVFCTKKKPNCKACPMKGGCLHYSNARKRLALPEPKERTTIITYERKHKSKHVAVNFRWLLEQEVQRSKNCEPIIEEPRTPEREYLEHDTEDYPWDNKVEGGTSKDLLDEISMIILNKRVGTSKDLVLINTQETSIPQHEMKVEGKLCTGHLTYELPDHHYLLKGFERREDEDVVPYMLAIWTRAETPNSIQPPEQRCVSQESNTLCQEKKNFFCDKIREEKSQRVEGTILIPCRTAMKGAFPLNGTYFQTNEVFADHGSSINPIVVPTECLKFLPKRVTYFGSSVGATCKGFSLEAIQHTFQEGYVCVRGFNRENRKSQTLVKGLHSPPRKQKQPRRRGMKPS